MYLDINFAVYTVGKHHMTPNDTCNFCFYASTTSVKKKTEYVCLNKMVGSMNPAMILSLFDFTFYSK